jgi:hypothetical protein
MAFVFRAGGDDPHAPRGIADREPAAVGRPADRGDRGPVPAVDGARLVERRRQAVELQGMARSCRIDQPSGRRQEPRRLGEVVAVAGLGGEEHRGKIQLRPGVGRLSVGVRASRLRQRRRGHGLLPPRFGP